MGKLYGWESCGNAEGRMRDRERERLDISAPIYQLKTLGVNLVLIRTNNGVEVIAWVFSIEKKLH